MKQISYQMIIRNPGKIGSQLDTPHSVKSKYYSMPKGYMI